MFTFDEKKLSKPMRIAKLKKMHKNRGHTGLAEIVEYLVRHDYTIYDHDSQTIYWDSPSKGITFQSYHSAMRARPFFAIGCTKYDNNAFEIKSGKIALDGDESLEQFMTFLKYKKTLQDIYNEVDH